MKRFTRSLFILVGSVLFSCKGTELPQPVSLSDLPDNPNHPALPAGKYAVDPAKSHVELAPGAVLMTPEILAKSEILRSEEGYIISDDGYIVECDNKPVLMPFMDMKVPGSVHFAKGGYCIFDSTEDLPSGGVFIITAVQASDDPNYQVIKLEPTANPFKAYSNLDIGSKMFDEEGNPIEDAGLEIDLSEYLSEVTDAEGNPVEFSRNSDGEIVFDGEAVENIMSKAVTRKTFNTPKMGMYYSDKGYESSISAYLTIAMTSAIKIYDGELDYIHYNFRPTLNITSSFSLKSELSWSKTFHLLTLRFLPGIPIAPGVVLTPELNVSATLGIGGEMVFSTSITYKEELGSFGFSYVPAQGFTFQKEEAPQSKQEFNPELGADINGSVYATAGLIFEPAISLYGMFRAGIKVGFTMKFGLGLDYSYGYKLFLQPEISFTPITASLGGVFSKEWKELIPKIEFDPIWERYLFANNVVKRGSFFGESSSYWTPMLAGSMHHGQPYILNEDYIAVPSGVLQSGDVCTDLDGFFTDLYIGKPLLDSWELVAILRTASNTISPLVFYPYEFVAGQAYYNPQKGGWLAREWEQLDAGELCPEEEAVKVRIATVHAGAGVQEIKGITPFVFDRDVTYRCDFVWVNRRTGVEYPHTCSMNGFYFNLATWPHYYYDEVYIGAAEVYGVEDPYSLPPHDPYEISYQYPDLSAWTK